MKPQLGFPPVRILDAQYNLVRTITTPELSDHFWGKTDSQCKNCKCLFKSKARQGPRGIGLASNSTQDHTKTKDRSPSSVYCSTNCRSLDHNHRKLKANPLPAVMKNCALCETEFKLIRWGGGMGRKYCSKSCSVVAGKKLAQAKALRLRLERQANKRKKAEKVAEVLGQTKKGELKQ